MERGRRPADPFDASPPRNGSWQGPGWARSPSTPSPPRPGGTVARGSPTTEKLWAGRCRHGAPLSLRLPGHVEGDGGSRVGAALVRSCVRPSGWPLGAACFRAHLVMPTRVRRSASGHPVTCQRVAWRVWTTAQRSSGRLAKIQRLAVWSVRARFTTTTPTLVVPVDCPPWTGQASTSVSVGTCDRFARSCSAWQSQRWRVLAPTTGAHDPS